MSLPKVLLISFAPDHSSGVNRVHDCAGGAFALEVYQSATDKVNESLASRVLSMKLPRLFLHLLRSDAQVFWAWGLDACFIASFATVLRPGIKLIWDITDINPRLLSDSWRARLLRAIEGLLLRRADLLLLTSPAFFSEYFEGRIAPQKVAVIENLLPGTPPVDFPPPPVGGPCVIVYSGIFRAPVVLKVLREVAESMPGEVEFHLHGYPDRSIEAGEFEALVSGCPGIHFHGRFKPAELPQIYAKAHLAWGFLDPDANDNERWLLTNRIYNGVSFSRPVITNSDTYCGTVVAERKIGATCHLSADEIRALLRALMADGRARYEALRRDMPPPATAFLSGHYREVIEQLLGASHGRDHPVSPPRGQVESSYR